MPWCCEILCDIFVSSFPKENLSSCFQPPVFVPSQSLHVYFTLEQPIWRCRGESDQTRQQWVFCFKGCETSIRLICGCLTGFVSCDVGECIGSFWCDIMRTVSGGWGRGVFKCGGILLAALDNGFQVVSAHEMSPLLLLPRPLHSFSQFCPIRCKKSKGIGQFAHIPTVLSVKLVALIVMVLHFCVHLHLCVPC